MTDTSLGRRIVLNRNGSLHVYVLLDASGSVQQDNFELFRQSAVAIVDRVRGGSRVGPWGDHRDMEWDHGGMGRGKGVGPWGEEVGPQEDHGEMRRWGEVETTGR